MLTMPTFSLYPSSLTCKYLNGLTGRQVRLPNWESWDFCNFGHLLTADGQADNTACLHQITAIPMELVPLNLIPKIVLHRSGLAAEIMQDS